MMNLRKTGRRITFGGGLAIMIVGALALAGCGDKVTEPFRDAPRSGVENDGAADIIFMPDGFSNASTKCDHGNRIYIAYHADSPYAAIAVVPQDPTCPAG